MTIIIKDLKRGLMCPKDFQEHLVEVSLLEWQDRDKCKKIQTHPGIILTDSCKVKVASF